MGSAKIIMTLWVRQKKPIKPLIELDPQDLEDAGHKETSAPLSPAHHSISPQGIEEIKESRSVVKSKLNEWHD